MSSSSAHTQPCVAVIGGGPAGLMAAEVIAARGMQVELFDAMPSVGRKFLMAGKGGMNITHSEPIEAFVARYAERRAQLAPLIQAFGPQQLRDWIHALGIDTFVGSSGRVFPTDMKAAPLLRAWLHRLREAGVVIHVRHRWQGDIEARQSAAGRRYTLGFATPEGVRTIEADAVVLALGGASWARLGSDGAWLPWLQQHGVDIAALQAANCGFDAGWSEHLRERFAGEAVKAVTASCIDAHGYTHTRQGEFVVTENGVEGGLIYALSALLREQINEQGQATLFLDLAPGKALARVMAEVDHPRGSRSMSSHLQSRVGIKGVKMALLRECLPTEDFADAGKLAAGIKALPVKLLAPRPLDEVISTAGGVRFEALDEQLMLTALPGVFCAGEMLDWEAPTGGYLLTACFASARRAGEGVLDFMQRAGLRK
ncbi:TIGR03862 family flavoprotein [Uliginosibacterium sp. H3]|uniref:TIGR03862 family flavoprotein n=1 Tax=Uliginosibacterium silvisoli TaxID=3114758 RepID=A0ABU6K0W9_9RHOO|nr:TIGR03862 family flavoprotein [Uliginosibacterium sp. H3]